MDLVRTAETVPHVRAALADLAKATWSFDVSKDEVGRLLISLRTPSGFAWKLALTDKPTVQLTCQKGESAL